jgi:hypothetical protein
MKTYRSLISKFGFSALALAIAVGLVVAAHVASASAACWCCTKGKVTHVPIVVCQQGHGHCYDTEAEARKACKKRSNTISGAEPNS